MPSAQVIDFGADPYANAMGSFAENALTTINEKTAQRRNEDIFSKIKSKYGKDANPEDIFKDVLEAEGLDQEYKRNKLNEIKDYATLSTKNKLSPYQKSMLEIREKELNIKKDKEERDKAGKGISDYQKKVLANQELRLKQDAQRLKQAADAQDKKLPEYVSKYTSQLLKEAEVKLPVHDKADLNSYVEKYITEDKLSASEAFNKAYDYIQQRREKIDSTEITARPNPWIGSANPQEIEKAMEEAYMQLKALHDEDGVDNQKELRSIAEKAGWEREEITMMLQKIFQRAGKKMKQEAPKAAVPDSADAFFED